MEQMLDNPHTANSVIRHVHLNINDSFALKTVDKVITRQDVLEIEAEMLKMPQVDLAVNHHFSNGVYARELIIPAGCVIVGKIHKYENLNILLKGELSVLVDNEIKRVKAPYISVSPAGTKRIAYAHADSIWLTIHGTCETDVDKIEDHFIAQTEIDYFNFCEQQMILPLEGK